MARLEPGAVVVCDAGPLIHLDELDCLDLLADFEEVYVPEAVWGEVLKHRPAALSHAPPLRRVARVPEPTERVAFVLRVFTLHAGEQEALRLLERFPGATLLTDDLAARHAAQHLGCPISGTVGLLVRAHRRNLRTRQQILQLLQAIPRRSTLFIDRRLLDSVIEQVRQDS